MDERQISVTMEPTAMEPPIINEKPHRLYPSVRLLMFMLVLLGCTTLGGGFAAFNFSIVCMVNETAVEGDNAHWKNDSLCGGGQAAAASEEEILTKKGYDGEFDWSRTTQASLIAAYSFGAIALNLPSGLLSDRYGSKLLFGLSIALTALALAISPTCAYAGVPWIFVARIIQGIGGGMAWPPILSIVSRWGTPAETGILVTLGALGYQVGPLIAMFTSGLICDSSYRWPLIFYIWASLSAVFLVLWWFIYTDDPSKCRFISQSELAYLEKYQMRKKNTSTSLWDIPWKSILTSPCVLCVYVCQFSATWANFYIAEFMPTYSKEVLHFDVHSNGFTSAMPALMQVVSRLIIGPIADRLTFGGRSKTFGIKVFTCVCTFAPCVCFLVLSFLDCRQSALAVACFALASACLSMSVVGYLRGGVLVAARYAGITGALGNITAYAGGIIMPYATGAMIKRQTLPEWRSTLYLASAVLVVSGIQFMVFGSAQQQPWADGQQKKETHKVYTIDAKTITSVDGDKKAAAA